MRRMAPISPSFATTDAASAGDRCSSETSTPVHAEMNSAEASALSLSAFVLAAPVAAACVAVAIQAASSGSHTALRGTAASCALVMRCSFASRFAVQRQA